MRLPGRPDRPAASAVPPAAPVNPHAALIGRAVLGRYTLERFLGAGSNADVYLAAVAQSANRKAVVKRIKPHIAATSNFRSFFDNEVRSMSRFKHPYAVRLLDAALDDPIGPCLVLEYIPGVTLEDVLATFQRLPAEHAGRLLCQLCHALLAAHKAGIMHRDLKPANIMVMHFGTKHESLKVMDFGFAGFTTKPHIQLADLTGSGQHFACGTPAYVSPEMIRGDTVDHRADLYSVGVIFYEMLCGKLPFETNELHKLMEMHLESAPPPFRSHNVKDVPPAVEQAVQLALSKFPNERQQSARELAEHVSKALGRDLWTETTPPGYSVNDTITDVAVPEVETLDTASQRGPEESFALYDRFEAMMPERLAAAKLRGFIEDVGGVAVASEPGLIRVRVDLPAGYTDPSQSLTRSGIMNWLSMTRKPSVPRGREPIEVDLRMSKLDANRVAVVASFRPLREFLPDDRRLWQQRCEGLYSLLRKYVMAG